MSRSSRLALHDGGTQFERFWQRSLNLGQNLLDDMARFFKGMANHGHDKLERSGSSSNDRRETEHEHLGQINHPLRGFSKREHLENRWSFADLAIGSTQFVTRNLHAHFRPLRKKSIFVDRFHQVLANEKTRQTVAFGEVLTCAFMRR